MEFRTEEKIAGLKTALQVFDGQNIPIQSLQQLRSLIGKRANAVLAQWIDNHNDDLERSSQFQRFFRSRIKRQLESLQNTNGQ